MKLIYTSDNYINTDIIKSLLESKNIDCFIKNKALSGAAGLLPVNEIWPEVWIRNKHDESESLDIIKAFLSEQKSTTSWTCPCGETIEGQFTECWKCGHAIS